MRVFRAILVIRIIPVYPKSTIACVFLPSLDDIHTKAYFCLVFIFQIRGLAAFHYIIGDVLTVVLSRLAIDGEDNFHRCLCLTMIEVLMNLNIDSCTDDKSKILSSILALFWSLKFYGVSYGV